MEINLEINPADLGGFSFRIQDTIKNRCRLALSCAILDYGELVRR